MRVLLAETRARISQLRSSVLEFWPHAQFVCVGCAGDAIAQLRLWGPDLVITGTYLSGWSTASPCCNFDGGHVPAVGTGLDVAKAAAFYQVPCLLVSESADLPVVSGTMVAVALNDTDLAASLRAALHALTAPVPQVTSPRPSLIPRPLQWFMLLAGGWIGMRT